MFRRIDLDHELWECSGRLSVRGVSRLQNITGRAGAGSDDNIIRVFPAMLALSRERGHSTCHRAPVSKPLVPWANR